ncbi:MAG: hypothetical protein MUC79_11075 [Thiobacillaceae bacterium]|jgi:hypothetical protein|nr:hypothetical protein [Thiobacillaceae bacterium]
MQETGIADLRQQANRVMRAYTELDALWNIIVAEARQPERRQSRASAVPPADHPPRHTRATGEGQW